MQKDFFKDAVKTILKLASTNLMKAAVETGFIEDLYEIGDFSKLDFSIDEICYELTKEVFKESKTLEISEWKRKAHSPEIIWLLNFESIR